MELLKKINISLVVLPVLIFSLGYLTLLSTSPDRAKSQLIFFLISIIGYVVLFIIDYRILKPYWKHIFIVSLALLILTYILGEVRQGSVRWLNIAGFTFQPSEFAKLALIYSLPAAITSSYSSLKNWRQVFAVFGMSVLMFVLVAIQPDLGTSIVIISAAAFILFYSGLSYWYFIGAFTVMGIFSAPVWELLHDYQKRRILVFLNPALDVLGSGYNVIQSMIAVGSGGLMGKGFGRGTQSQLSFLPAHWTDFAFASFAEEWGFIGSLVLIALFLMLLGSLLFVIYTLQKSEEHAFGVLITIGVFAVFFTQFFINVGMNMGVMPVTGIPLPFISSGGSSILVSMLLLGLVQSIWIRR